MKRIKPEPIILEPDPVIEAYKRDIDRTLLIENLKLTPEQRVLKLIGMQKFYEEAQRSLRQERDPTRNH